MPPVHLARLYRNYEHDHMGDIPLESADPEEAAEAAKVTLAAYFEGQPNPRLKPTVVILAEALPNSERRHLRRFYLQPDGSFEERPVEWPPKKGKATRVEQYGAA